jgi:hypothetical protein
MKTAVQDSATAQKALQQVLQYLRKTFSMHIRETTRLQLVDAQVLAKLRRKNPLRIGKKDRRALGLFLQQGSRFDVYVETLLPYTLCLKVLAHEYTHAWEADHFPSNTGILYVEGLAEWIAYQTLLYYRHTTEASKIPPQQDEYGQGFAKIQAIEQRYGRSQVIQKVLQVVQKGK